MPALFNMAKRSDFPLTALFNMAKHCDLPLNYCNLPHTALFNFEHFDLPPTALFNMTKLLIHVNDGLINMAKNHCQFC